MRLHLLLASAAAVVMAAPAMVQPASAQTQPQATAATAPMQDVVVDEGVLRPLQIAVVPFTAPRASAS